MNGQDAVIALVEAFEALHVPYMLVGSLSSNAHGIARSTHDADFVIQLEPGFMQRIVQSIGPAFLLDPQMSFETVTGTYRYLITLADDPFKIELFLLSSDAHDQQRFQRRIRKIALGREIFFPTAEDVIVTKLRWSKQGRRTKDADDARNVIAVQGDRLDWDYIHSWCDPHGTRTLLDEIRRSIPVIDP